MDDKLAKDLVAMWQSELTAMAADREFRETWAATMALWAQAANAAAALLPHELFHARKRQPRSAAAGPGHCCCTSAWPG